ncbi:J domain-containing protein [Dermabacteraceae bacterium TAE3-ERU27]|nr:J domain-containing protein [Dermabacteraceae bacterium TAE3-ERU27]
MDDYYELLELSPSASSDEIKAQIPKIRRKWSKRSESPSAEKRVQAELNVAKISEAQKVLLDPAARRKYDSELAGSKNTKRRDVNPVPVPIPVPVPEPEPRRDYLGDALRYMDIDDPRSALNMAYQAIRQDGESVDSLELAARAALAIKDCGAARELVTRAVFLDSDNAGLWGLRAQVEAEGGNKGKAAEYYQRASSLDPQDSRWKMFCISESEDLGDALKQAAEVYAKDPADHLARDVYVNLLVRDAYSCLTIYDGMYYFTSRKQVKRVSANLGKVAKLKSSNREILASVENLNAMLRKAKERHFHSPGCGGLLLMLFLMQLIYYLGILVVNRVFGDGLLSSLLGWGVLFLVLKFLIDRVYRPQWLINRKSL